MLQILKSEMSRLGQEESGVALMMTLSVFMLLFVLCAGVYSIGETVRQKVELQNACDSAAYSAALVQADGLSRMAMVNRAMSWTYVQLTNMQIDYITYRWLELVAKRFNEDYKRCEEYNKGTSFGGFGFLTSKCSANDNLMKPGIGWFCGIAGKGMRRIRLNGHESIFINGEETPVTVDLIEQYLQSFSQIATYPGQIAGMKKMIEHFNAALGAISIKMHQSMAQTVSVVLAENLPRDEKGDIDKELASDFLFYQHVPFPVAEDAFSPYDDDFAGILTDPELDIPTPRPMGYFSPLLNNERDERIFLTMADGKVYDTLTEYFGPSGIDGSYMAGGLDQWFVRTYTNEVTVNRKSFSPSDRLVESYMNHGICRAYKNANRTGGVIDGVRYACRAHHHSLDDDSPPSCLNTHDNCPEQCHAVPDSIGLVAEYEWSSGKYRLQCFHIHKIGRNPHVSHIHYYNIDFLDRCTAGHNCSVRSGSHSRREYFSCVADDKDLEVPFTSIKWPPIPILPLPCSGGYNIGVGGSYSLPTTERNWVLTEWIARFSNVVEPNGFARIYGDDTELVDKDHGDCWYGTPAKPWVLNDSFYKDGATIVGFARKQRNPWVSLFNSVSDVVSSDKSDEEGVYSAFNPVDGGYIVAFSAARAAHRFHPSDGALAWTEAHKNAPPLYGMATGEYETRYDAVCDDRGMRFNMQGEFAPSRVGCVCNDVDNGARFARCWNLCETDWDATLLPLRYAWSGLSSEWYDSLANAKSEMGNVAIWENVGRDDADETGTGYDPLEYAARMPDSWAKLFDSSGNLLVVEKDGKVPAAFKVPEQFMRMNVPLDRRIVNVGTEKIGAPYSSFELNNVRVEGEAPSPKLDVQNLYRVKVL